MSEIEKNEEVETTPEEQGEVEPKTETKETFD